MNALSGADIRPNLSDLAAVGNAWISSQSGIGDVHDQDIFFLAGWGASRLLCSLCKLR